MAKIAKSRQIARQKLQSSYRISASHGKNTSPTRHRTFSTCSKYICRRTICSTYVRHRIWVVRLSCDSLTYKIICGSCDTIKQLLGCSMTSDDLVRLSTIDVRPPHRWMLPFRWSYASHACRRTAVRYIHNSISQSNKIIGGPPRGVWNADVGGLKAHVC